MNMTQCWKAVRRRTGLAAPEEPRLHVRDADEIAVLVEQHIRLTRQVKEAEER